MKKLILLISVLVLFPIPFASNSKADDSLSGKWLFCQNGLLPHRATGIHFKEFANVIHAELIHIKGYNINYSSWTRTNIEIDRITLGSVYFTDEPYAKINRQTLEAEIKWEGMKIPLKKFECSVSSMEEVNMSLALYISYAKKKNKI